MRSLVWYVFASHVNGESAAVAVSSRIPETQSIRLYSGIKIPHLNDTVQLEITNLRMVVICSAIPRQPKPGLLSHWLPLVQDSDWNKKSYLEFLAGFGHWIYNNLQFSHIPKNWSHLDLEWRLKSVNMRIWNLQHQSEQIYPNIGPPTNDISHRNPNKNHRTHESRIRLRIIRTENSRVVRGMTVSSESSLNIPTPPHRPA